jgi:hypothetical protein
MKRGGGKSEFGQSAKSKAFDGAKYLESDTNQKITIERRGSSFLKPPTQQTEPQKISPFRRKENGIESSPLN